MFILQFVDNIKWMLIRAWRRVKHVLAFARFAWTDWDYDSLYLFKLIHFKLKRMEKNFQTGSRDIDDDDNSLKSIRVSIKLLEGVLNQDRSLCRFLNQYGDSTLDFSADNRFKEIPPPGIELEQYIEFRQKAMNEDIRREKRNSRLLFRIMEKYYMTWWD